MPTTRKTIKTGKLFRSFELDRAAINQEERTVPLSFSSETSEVERWFGVEILDHSAKSVRLKRLMKGGPLLMDHNPMDQVGVIEEVGIGMDRTGRAVVRFGKSARAEEVFQDVLDGIRKNVSVSYITHRMVLEEEGKNKPPVYRVTDWEPLEISIVSVPADISVGIGRSGEGDYETEVIEERSIQMPEIDNEHGGQRAAEPPAPQPQVQRIDVDAVRAEERKLERNRTAEISAIGRQFNLEDMAADAIAKGDSIDNFRKVVMDKIGTKPVDLDMSKREEKGYSVIRAINIAAGIERGESFEMDIHQEISKKLGRSSKGIYMPLSLPVKMRTSAPITTGASPQGGATVPTYLMPMIEMLRARMMVRRMGATVMSGLTGNVSFPKHTAGAGLSWTGEAPGSDVGDSTPTFGVVSLTPKTAQSNVPFTRQLLQQSSEDVENFVRNDLLMANALGLDLASISGSGQSNEPTGILYTTGIGAVAMGDDGGAPDWASIVALETEVATDNADFGSLGYLTNSKVRGLLKVTAKAGNYPTFIWEKGSEPGFGEMNGYRAGSSNQVPSNLVKGGSGANCSAVIFGNWADLLIGEFGVVELIADPYTLKKQGIIEVTSIMMVDIAVRHAESFAAIKDALTQ